MPAPIVVAGSAVALFNAVRAGVFIYDIHRKKKIREKEEDAIRLERARRDEAMAYQRAKDSRKALDFAHYHLMGDQNAESNYFRGYTWNPYSLRYDLQE